MPITQAQILEAKQSQDLAAQDTNKTIRLVAGPGTGKSFVIEGRVGWLLSQQNVQSTQIAAVSFTRAAAKDLKRRIYKYCEEKGLTDYDSVRISTLHSLALYILKRTGNLEAYPVEPVIMDTWESEKIFDAEFAKSINKTDKRGSEIRLDHEGFWCTGNWNSPNQPVVQTPITVSERSTFKSFNTQRTQLFACVLPGEVVRKCVELINQGFIDPIQILGVSHMIVDEVQDLNPCDFELINLFIQHGASVFICGDDDQSVYSFRYAFPQGIQDFITNHQTSSDHILNDCFRCTPQILNAAKNVLENNQAPNRIPKNLISLYESSNPKNDGFILGNKFQSSQREAAYIANSCKELIASGVEPKELMILLGNKRVQLKEIKNAFDEIGVDFNITQSDEFKESSHGRFLMSLFNLIANPDNYLAYRVLLGTPRGIGIATLKSISDKVILNNIKYRAIFNDPFPANVFDTRERKAIEKAKSNISSIEHWNINSTIHELSDNIQQILLDNFSLVETENWKQFISSLPDSMTIEELTEFLRTDSQEAKDSILQSVQERIGLSESTPIVSNKVRFSTFHSSKGLDAKVVFIPGLEEEVFPTLRAGQITGLILENARLLYVAITRAKAACFISYSTRRSLNGQSSQMRPSRFCQSTGISFQWQNDDKVLNGDVSKILDCIANLGVE